MRLIPALLFLFFMLAWPSLASSISPDASALVQSVWEDALAQAAKATLKEIVKLEGSDGHVPRVLESVPLDTLQANEERMNISYSLL